MLLFTPTYPVPQGVSPSPRYFPLRYQVPQSYVEEIEEIVELRREIAPPAAAGFVDLRSSSAPAARGGTPLYYPLTSSSVPSNR